MIRLLPFSIIPLWTGLRLSLASCSPTRDATLRTRRTHDRDHDLQPKCDQGDQFAVVDLSVGNKDLQQCADVIMRIRAEYFYAMKHFDRIKFTRSCDADS